MLRSARTGQQAERGFGAVVDVCMALVGGAGDVGAPHLARTGSVPPTLRYQAGARARARET